MTIAIEGFDLLFDTTARGETARETLRQVARAMPGSSFLLYTPRMPRRDAVERLGLPYNVEFRLPAPQGFHGQTWRLWGIPNHLAADRADIFHGPFGRLPLNISSARVEAVVSVADDDLGPGGGVKGWARRVLVGKSCRSASLIIAGSDAAKERIAGLYGVDKDRVAVIGGGDAKRLEGLYRCLAEGNRPEGCR